MQTIFSKEKTAFHCNVSYCKHLFLILGLSLLSKRFQKHNPSGHFADAKASSSSAARRELPGALRDSCLFFCKVMTGWWFGTSFTHILGIVIPIDQYFSEGWNHQPEAAPLAPAAASAAWGCTGVRRFNMGNRAWQCYQWESEAWRMMFELNSEECQRQSETCFFWNGWFGERN